MTRRRFGTRTLGILAAVAALGGLAACNPRFPEGSQLTVTPLSGGYRVSWPAAEELDQGQVIDRYRVDVNGTTIASLPAATRSCTISTTTTLKLKIEVTAYDDHEEWSAGWKTEGTLTSTVGSGASFTGALLCATGSSTPYLPATVEKAALSSDGRNVAAGYVVSGERHVEIIDRSNGTTTSPSVLAGDVIWTATDDLRWFGLTTSAQLVPEDTDDTYDAYVWDRTTGALQFVPSDRALWLRVSEDGSSAVLNTEDEAFSTQGLMDVEHIDLTTGTRSPIGIAFYEAPSISPDGRYVAYRRPESMPPGSPTPSESWASLQLWDRETEALTPLTTTVADPLMPTSFSRDGATLSFATDPSGILGLPPTSSVQAVVDRDLATGATVRRPMPSLSLVDRTSTWSANNRWLSTTSKNPSPGAQDYGVQLVAADGRGPFLGIEAKRFGTPGPSVLMSDDGAVVLVQSAGGPWYLWTPST